MIEEYYIINNIAKRRGYKKQKRKRLKLERWRRYVNHSNNIARTCRLNGTEFIAPPRHLEAKIITLSSTRPSFSDTIDYLAKQHKAFSKKSVNTPADGIFSVPQRFSLTENNEDSFIFLKRLFFALYHDKCETIIIDYKDCEWIDLDASVCMDIMLREFKQYISRCRARRFKLTLKRITVQGMDHPQVIKLLFSIGSYQILRGIQVNFKGMVNYPLCVGSKKRRNAGAKREIDITNLMDYVLRSLRTLKKELTAEAEDNLYKVIGEILINAEEHSDMNHRYSIGYFQKSTDEEECDEGIFNLVILNFGKTIYEKFKDPTCPNQTVVGQMQGLSEAYTTKRLFFPAEFEEETLWTLYALQEGVTSHKDWKRGNGSIRFIDSFFKLRGSSQFDNISKMTIMSGNARIVFDGTYEIMERAKPGQRKPTKLMTFNDSGNFDEQPDKKFVNFADNYFPGTMIVAKISLKSNVLESSGGQNGTN